MMKKFQFLTIPLIAVTLLIFNSCSKDEPKPSNKYGVFQCKVNGTSWTSAGTSVSYQEMSSDTVLEIIGAQIKGTDTTFISLSLLLTPQKTGVYQGETSLTKGWLLYYPSTNQYKQLEILTKYKTTYHVEITKFDLNNHLISGTFSNVQTAPAGQGLPDFVVTEGSFNNLYIY